MKKIILQTIPHKTKSKTKWCLPVIWCWIFGGNYDSGNGYGWYPGMKHMIQRYYKEKWFENGYTIWKWIEYPTINKNRKKLNVNQYGLW